MLLNDLKLSSYSRVSPMKENEIINVRPQTDTRDSLIFYEREHHFCFCKTDFVFWIQWGLVFIFVATDKVHLKGILWFNSGGLKHAPKPSHLSPNIHIKCVNSSYRQKAPNKSNNLSQTVSQNVSTHITLRENQRERSLFGNFGQYFWA